MLAVMVLALGVQAVTAAAVMAVGSLSVPQGGTVTISGNIAGTGRCAPGAPVQLTSTPETAGGANLFPAGTGPQVPTDASGNFHVAVDVPASTPVGSYIIGVVCGGTTVGTSETLVVSAAANVTVSPASAQQGATVTISGVVVAEGSVVCPPGGAAQLTSTSALFPPSGTGPQLTRSAVGKFSATYVIPSTATPGTYTIGVHCTGGSLSSVATLQVAAGVAPTTTTTPTTTATTVPSTTVAPATTLPVTTVPFTTTTTTPSHQSTAKKSKGTNRYFRWGAIGLFVLVFLAAAVTIVRHGDAAKAR